MKLTDIDGNPVYVRAQDIVLVSKGHTQRPTKVLAPSANGLRLANGQAHPAEGEQVMETIPLLVMLLRGLPGQHGIADNETNRTAIEEAMDSVYAE